VVLDTFTVFDENGLNRFPQGLKPIARQPLIVGAKAPTP